MCGILFQRTLNVNYMRVRLLFNKMKYRGPDHSDVHQIDSNTVVGFHRLSINDVSDAGHQPFKMDNYIMICNGEIFNYKELEKKYNFNFHSQSDCEVILHLFKYFKYNLKHVLAEINGEFAFVIYDTVNEIVYAARDFIGVRPLFIYSGDQGVCFLSEAKGTDLRPCRQFLPGHHTTIHFEGDKKISETTDTYIPYQKCFQISETKEQACIQMFELLREAVYCRVKTTDQELGCFLSGGLDSFITTYLTMDAMKRLGRDPRKLKVFTIGFKDCNSKDVESATEIAKLLNVEHYVYTPSLELGFETISQTIYHLESWDTTTVRASVPQYLLSKYITENTNVRVLISGEGSDELLAGYLYFNQTPNAKEFIKERKKLISELCYFDVLRTDRTTSANSLEVRVPFLDSTFVSFVHTLNSDWILPKHNSLMTKSMLRSAFDNYLLSNASNFTHSDLIDIRSHIGRIKDAFSDAVGHRWTDYIQETLETKPNNIQMSEAEYYQMIFISFYGEDHVKTIPHYWMPNWQPKYLKDPSARFLK